MFFGRGALQCPAATILTRRLLGKDPNNFLLDPSPPSFAAHLKLVKPSLFFVRNISRSLHASITGISSVRSFGFSSLTMASSGSEKKPNRLAQEKSPYLLQHAYNPVDWYPWGEEAFERAKKEDKLIFLSVGYSTCHWCHVMEHESFENEEIAKIMNKHFINIKVDREERPDVDKVYMTFVQASAGRGGWPMSVFLTPTLNPVAGGTYFPPKDMFGRPGFPTVLNSLATQASNGQGGWPMSTWLTPDLTPVHGGTYYPPNDRYYGQPGFKSLLLIIANQWKENRQKFFDSGSKILEVLQKHSKLEVSPDNASSVPVPSADCWRTCFSQLVRSYEIDYGGFATAPKFPQPANFNFLFHVYARNPTSEEGKEALEMCTHTLKMMAKGGIHDHVSQGFARYSTDERWHVPHFEKMLYDQAQLMVAYASAYTATKNELFAEVIRDIVYYVNRDLSHPLGGFYSAEDADSLPSFDSEKKREGAFCAWKYEEVQALLGDKLVHEEKSVTLAELACHHYDIKHSGNVNPYQDPHDELTGQNILIIIGSEEETAEKFALSLSETKAGLQKIKEILYEARQNRPRPHLDDKMVAAWNGLMLSGLSKASEALGDENIVKRATRAAQFIREHLYNKETGTLLRSCYQGPNSTVSQIANPIAGFADDYAFVVRGLLDLYEASAEYEWLEWAEQLQDKQDTLFWDTEAGGYFSAAKDPAIVLRLKDGLCIPKGAWPEYELHDMIFLYFQLRKTMHVQQEIQKVKSAYQDGAEPTCNSVSVSNLVRLSSLLERPDLHERAARLLAAFSSRLTTIPVSLPEMSSSLLLFQDSPTQVIVAGDPAAESTRAMLSVVRGRLVPGRVLGHADGNKDGVLYRRNETVRGMRPVKPGAASAYVCHNHACSLPVSTPEMLLSLLEERFGA